MNNMIPDDRPPIPPRTDETDLSPGVALRTLVQDDGRESIESAGGMTAAGALAVAEALGPDTLIDYTAWRKANNISHELGMRLRKEGQLKVLKVGSKLMLRLGEARRFVRGLPLA